MDSDVVALVSVVVSPIAALIGVWMTSRLSEKARARDREDKAREEALRGLGEFIAVLVDGEPRLVAHGDLREYDSPGDAISGLYARWAAVRQPLMLLNVTHPSREVRRLAFQAQAQMEMVLRQTDDCLQGKSDLSPARFSYDELQGVVRELAKKLSPFLGDQ